MRARRGRAVAAGVALSAAAAPAPRPIDSVAVRLALRSVWIGCLQIVLPSTTAMHREAPAAQITPSHFERTSPMRRTAREV